MPWPTTIESPVLNGIDSELFFFIVDFSLYCARTVFCSRICLCDAWLGDLGLKFLSFRWKCASREDTE